MQVLQGWVEVHTCATVCRSWDVSLVYYNTGQGGGGRPLLVECLMGHNLYMLTLIAGWTAGKAR